MSKERGMSRPNDLRYSKEHEWVRFVDGIAVVGITDYAQDSLGDIVYVELPRAGMQIQQFVNVGVVESVKAVSDLFSPVGGEVVEVNEALDNDPALLNREPFTGGWLFKVKLAGEGQLSGLLDAAAYDEMLNKIILPVK
jgi:glycine cleavage system H protein